MSERSITGWLQAVYPVVDLPPQIRKLEEENAEAKHARENGNTPQEIGREHCDIAFVALGIASMYGLDPVAELDRLIDKNYVKYPPEVVQNIVGLGYSHAEAMAMCKSQWVGDDVYDKGGNHAIQYPLPNVF